MANEVPGPPLGALRAASANLMAASLAASLFPHAVKAAADEQRYLLDAQTIGADPAEAERVLAEVRDELLRAGHPPQLACRIAWRRLLEQPGERPPEHARDAARQALQLGGEPCDPENVDQFARWLESLQPPEQCPLTAEQAARVVATMADCADRSRDNPGGPQSRHRRREG
jgi:hypothetical protein